MYIGYDTKNGVKYAKLCKSTRVNGKVKTEQKSLGRVLDEKRGIYQSRERGIFTYDLQTDTYGTPESAVIPVVRRSNSEKLILDFGDAWFLDSFIRKKKLNKVIEAIDYGNNDSVRALIQYYILCNMANCHAETWYEGSYARMLYPRANLASQRISDMLASLGDEWTYREFFKAYLSLLAKKKDGENILIDSTGLPNSIHFPLTAVSNHNGKISNEVRLIYVVQQGTNLPLYFRYVAGNIIDVSTLTKTMMELKAYNVDTKFAVLDAGYLTEQNIQDLFEAKVSFLSRMKENTSLYKNVISENLPSLESEENLVSYNGRYAYIKRVKTECWGHSVYAYLGRDLAMQSLESSKLYDRAEDKKMSTADIHRARSTQGLFVLASSRPISIDKVLPKYYMRSQIEQVFDICKNNTNMLPLRVQSEETFRGHLLIAFTASVVVRMLQEDLAKSSYTPESAFLALRNHKCKVFDDQILTMESVKKANDIYKIFKLKIPDTISVPV
ncbi:MAG: transposase [Butyrivibrio sp.]|nr:transposase [Butyrivibrio sp.]